MSVKSLCLAVLSETGWPAFSTIAESSEGTAKQIFAIANTELRAVSNYGDWPQLSSEYEFTTVAGQAEYEMPEDFHTGKFNALYAADGYYLVRGSYSDENWYRVKYGLLSGVSRTRFKVGVNATGTRTTVTLSPTPTDAIDLVMAYKSNMFARTSDGSDQQTFQNDGDNPKVPEFLIELGVKWRFRRAKGLDHSAELAEYNNTLQSQLASFRRPTDIKIGGVRLGDDTGLTEGSIPDTGFGL